MTEPTDAELEALAVEHEAFGFGLADKRGLSTHGFDPDGLRSFARAVLAKWGHPAGAGEHKQGCPALGGYGHGVEECCCGATPQPTQAQAGAVPLDSDDIRTYARNSLQDPAEEAGFFDGVRWAEEQHGIGIKGAKP